LTRFFPLALVLFSLTLPDEDLTDSLLFFIGCYPVGFYGNILCLALLAFTITAIELPSLEVTFFSSATLSCPGKFSSATTADFSGVSLACTLSSGIGMAAIATVFVVLSPRNGLGGSSCSSVA
jgi:hypothetical protein